MDIDDALKRRSIKVLEDEQNALIGAFDPQSDETAPTGLLFDKIEKNEDGTWSQTKYVPEETFYDENVVSVKEREEKDKADILRDVCASVDLKMMGINDEINELKQQIVNLSSEAEARNCNPGIAYSTGDESVIVDYGANTEVNKDAEFIKIWEKMAGPGFEADTENPFDPDSIIILQGEYIGYGYENVSDPLRALDEGLNPTGIATDGSGGSIGNGRFDLTSPASTHAAQSKGGEMYYPGAGVSPWASNSSLTGSAAQNRCEAIRGEIASLYTQINDKRKNLIPLREESNILKDNKSEKELTYWGLQNVVSEVTTRQTKNNAAIDAINGLDSGSIPAPEGLIGWFDVSNNSSYYGSGTTWYDLSELEEDASLEGSPGPSFINDPIDEMRDRFSLDGIDDHIDIESAPPGERGNRLGQCGNPAANTVTIEIFAKLQIDLNVQDDDGYILFGFEEYNVWTGPVLGDGTPFRLAFNTGNNDLYGLKPAAVNKLGLNNNFVHYVFEMRYDVSVDNNKIYINGNLQSGSAIQKIGTEDVAKRHFQRDIVISGWGRGGGSATDYRMPMELQLVRIYDKALTQTEITTLHNMLSGRFT